MLALLSRRPVKTIGSQITRAERDAWLHKGVKMKKVDSGTLLMSPWTQRSMKCLPTLWYSGRDNGRQGWSISFYFPTGERFRAPESSKSQGYTWSHGPLEKTHRTHGTGIFTYIYHKLNVVGSYGKEDSDFGFHQVWSGLAATSICYNFT